MRRASIGIVAIIGIVIASGWYLLKGTPVSAPTTTETPVVTDQMPVIGSTTQEMAVEAGIQGVTVVYTDQGFSPKNVTILDGTSVHFINQSSKKMWVASAVHPAHATYDGTSLNQHCTADYRATDNPAPFDECASGTEYSFTFTRIGTWGYHNHDSAGDTGTITVTATASSIIER